MRSGIGNSASDPLYVTQTSATTDANGAPLATPRANDAAGAKSDRTIATSTTSQQAAAANAGRVRFIIQNQDAAINAHINLGAAATTGGGSIRVGPGSTLTLEGTTQALNIIAASGSPVVTIWEF